MWTYWRSIKRISLEELCRAGAWTSIYQDGDMTAMEILDNQLKMLDEIRGQGCRRQKLIQRGGMK